MTYANDIVSCLGIYSLRRAASGYTGPAVQCIRKTDSGYDYSDFKPSQIQSIPDWSGGARVHVRIWYDQSGNGLDLVQNALEAQPIIAKDGVLLKRSGRPVLIQEQDGSLDLDLPASVDSYTVSLIGGASYITERPTLYELVMPRTTTRRRLVTRRDGQWAYLGKKYLDPPIVYGSYTSGLGVHTVRHVGSQINLWHDQHPTAVVVEDPGASTKLTVLNSDRGSEFGSYMSEFVISADPLKPYEARQLHLLQRSYLS